MPQSLAHISTDELTRLARLWHAQASSGQIEAREIAQAFESEKHHRLHADLVAQVCSIKQAKQRAWWKFWLGDD